jgi:endonuclease I
MERVPAPWAIFLALTFACLHPLATARADACDPPASYYSLATGTGATLKSQLNGIIDGHTVISYGNTPAALGVTDVDPNNSNNLLTVYDRTSISKVYSTNPLIWNREHTWPRSRGIGESGPDDSDLFNLRPALTEGNGDRQNFNFGGAYNSQGAGLVTAPNPDQWYPGNVDAGMIARQQFYMAVRYDGADSNTTDLELAVGNPAATTGTLGDKDRLVEWHFAAPPDNFERRRNQVIYDQYQHNRNPFTDRPEWAWSVFVDNANDSSLALAGGVVGEAGATTLNVDLGRRLVGSSLPAGQVVTLNKGGVDGTYYSVSAGGAATSTVTGRFNAFGIGAPGLRTLTVGLASGTSTATAGLKSGTVTIDNLDVTTGGGAANGANDGNDVINVGVSILDHANPSFTLGSDLNTLSLDFGAVTVGAAAPTLNFSLANLAATAGFTAALDLDGVSGSGATAVLATNLAPFSGAQSLPTGTSRSFQAMLSTATVGSFEASYMLNFSDENLVGASTLGSLALNLTGSVVAATATGDFDGDSDVDGGDFLIWQTGLGEVATAMRSDGDADGDQDVDEADYAIWRSTFVDPSGPPSHLVAEPTGSCLALVNLLLLMRPSPARRRRLVGGNAQRGGISVARS